MIALLRPGVMVMMIKWVRIRRASQGQESESEFESDLYIQLIDHLDFLLRC